MDGIVTMIEDPIPVTPQGLGKLFHLWMINSLCQQTPFLYGLLCPCAGPVGPGVFEYVSLKISLLASTAFRYSLFRTLSITLLN